MISMRILDAFRPNKIPDLHQKARELCVDELVAGEIAEEFTRHSRVDDVISCLRNVVVRVPDRIITFVLNMTYYNPNFIYLHFLKTLIVFNEFFLLNLFSSSLSYNAPYMYMYMYQNIIFI